MTDHNRFRITEDDVDYVAEALVSALEPVAERGRTLPRPTSCQVYLCTRPRSWLAKIEVAHPEHGTPEAFEVEICQAHSDEYRLEHFRNRLRWVGRPVQRYKTERLSA